MDNNHLLGWSLVGAGTLLDVAVAKGWSGWYGWTPPRGADANLVIGTAGILGGSYLLTRPETAGGHKRSRVQAGGVTSHNRRSRYRGH